MLHAIRPTRGILTNKHFVGECWITEDAFSGIIEKQSQINDLQPNLKGMRNLLVKENPTAQTELMKIGVSCSSVEEPSSYQDAIVCCLPNGLFEEIS